MKEATFAYRIAKQAVSRRRQADNTGGDRAAMKPGANLQLETRPMLHFEVFHELKK